MAGVGAGDGVPGAAGATTMRACIKMAITNAIKMVKRMAIKIAITMGTAISTIGIHAAGMTVIITVAGDTDTSDHAL